MRLYVKTLQTTGGNYTFSLLEDRDEVFYKRFGISQQLQKLVIVTQFKMSLYQRLYGGGHPPQSVPHLTLNMTVTTPQKAL